MDATYTGCTERVKSAGSYYDLLESIPEVIFILTPEGVISYLTPAFSELTGWKREQCIGKPFSELVDIEMRKDTLRTLSKLMNCPLKKSFDTKILVRSGGSISTEVSAKSRFMNGRVTGITGLLRDNRVKKFSQEVHALQEKRIRSLYEISAEPGMEIEAQLEEALRVWADMLSMEVAGIGQVSGRSCTVLYCHDEHGRFKQGFEFDLSKTYCKITLAMDDVVAFDHVAESEYRNDKSYRSFGFES
jgi:PAS domain S-box-containing protein